MRGKKLFLLVFFLILILLPTGCKQYRVGDTFVWIDVPITNLVFPDLQPINVEGHASAAEGVSKVEVYIDSDLFSTLNDLTIKGKLAYFQTTWTPTSPGEYTIMAIAYDSSNQASEIDSVRIFFGVGAPTDEDHTPTSTITETATLPTQTLTSTLDTPTPTSTSTLVTPSPTSTFTLTLAPPTLTPTITQTPRDTTPPPAPLPAVPADGLTLSCRSTQSLVWQPVSDPSGIAEYHVELQYSSDNINWSNAPESPITGLIEKTTPVSVDCGWYYRWRVRAVDGAGNPSEWSSWFYFTITLT